MWELLLTIYLINSTLLIVHEIDSAYWKEWELFRLPGGVTLFLLLHIPLVFLLLLGVMLVADRSPAGLGISVITAAAGVFAFGIHILFMAKGCKEFTSPISIAILAGIRGIRGPVGSDGLHAVLLMDMKVWGCMLFPLRIPADSPE